MSETLKEKTAKGLFWGALNSGTTQILNLVIGVFLARLLSPEDYGVVGVLTIFTAIAGDIQNSGFASALINLKQPTARDYNSVFSFNVCISVLMYAILFLCAPLIAAFFHQTCLVSVSRVVFLCFMIGSLGIAHSGYLQKNMMNKEIAIIGIISLISSGFVGITLALSHFSYWALVWQQITYISVTNIGRYYFVKDWHPRLSLDFGPVKRMAPFSLKILITHIFNDLNSNILTVIFGRLFPLHAVGNYSQAYKWNNMASSLISNMIGQIAQPVFVEGGNTTDIEDKNARELRIFRKMFRFTCFLSMPLMFGLALVSREFILVTLGAKWIECVPLLQIFCLSGAFTPLYVNYRHLAMSQGRSDIYMWMNIGQIIILIITILLSHSFGMTVMVWAYTTITILWLIPWHFWAGNLIHYSIYDVLRDIFPFMLAAFFITIFTKYFTSFITNIYILLICRFFVFAMLYYIVMKTAKVQILTECENFIFRKKKSE